MKLWILLTKASGPVVLEYALLLVVVATFDHLEDDVLQTCGLSNLPVDASPLRCRHCGHVDDEVADLAEEVVLLEIQS